MTGGGLGKQALVAAPRHVDSAKALEMGRGELRVQEHKAACAQAFDEMDQQTLDASRSRENMLSPKNARPSVTP